MSQSAISNRLNSNFGRVKDKELDLHTKLSIQAKQNALPKGILSQLFLMRLDLVFNCDPANNFSLEFFRYSLY